MGIADEFENPRSLADLAVARRAGEDVPEGEWRAAWHRIWLIDDNELLPAFLAHRDAIPPEHRRETLECAWSCCRRISQIDPGVLVPVFREIGFLGTDDLPMPTEPLVVYRGVPVGGTGEPRGMCWTTDRSRAEFFAQGRSYYRRTGEVYGATIPPAGVLARFGFEDEVVVDPEQLEDFCLLYPVGLDPRIKTFHPDS